MIEPHRKGSVMRPGHYLVVGATAVAAALVAWVVLHAVVGIVFEIVKVAVVAAIVVAVFWGVSRMARRHRS